ncbi:GNAT family N-acetyltransferase [Paenibacillus crassostreae]|uniref:Acetyltransferase n=1 Tax=Paenibacillus crassostreae TaxID=1763538 RepID=A0A167AH73_9BACL|nr:GNAT family N-acetyltransferase [Paenibacillus crassostreae]AOZ92301.1 GNAT family N-acetyltransferase [Paenibacillus crassostreae]OAB71018.1 acetyltransferase [Paenibacillus crassostreae]
MNLNFRVSQATINDLNELSVIFDLYRVFYEQVSNQEEARQFLFDRFEHAESIIHIARESSDNQIVGFAQLYPTFSSLSMMRSWVLNDLYVIEEYRKKGVAKELLHHVQDFAIKTRAKGIALSTGHDNKKAQSLYEFLGYVKDDEFQQYFLTLNCMNINESDGLN